MDWKHKRVGVLMGGMSAEREVSVGTGEAVYMALQDRGYDANKIFVDRDLDMVLRQSNIEVAFNALHGRYGEDGCVQGLLEVLGVPYTGSGVLASALCMDKVKTKEVLRLYNLPTPPAYTLVADQLHKVETIHGTFGYPCVVKPVSQGSSVGLSVARDPEELRRACEHGLRFDAQVLVERFIDGMEVTVGVLAGRAMGAMEIRSGRELFDYQAKYSPGETEYHLPARLSRGRYQGVLTQAVMAHRALGCDGVSRVDMVVSDDGNEFILEVNNLPGLSPSCMIPKIAHYCGIDYGDLVEAVLEEARLHTGVMSSPTLHAGAASADGASTDHPTPDVASAH